MNKRNLRRLRFIHLLPAALLAVTSSGAFSAVPSVNDAIGATLANQSAAAKGPDDSPVTIYTASKIFTMDRVRPEANAIAIAGKRIIATGSVDEIKATLGSRKVTIDNSLQKYVVLPGFIDQTDHPLLAALAFSTEVISTDTWTFADRSYPLAASQTEYMSRLERLNEKMKSRDEWLISWGYQPLWHGKLDRQRLDEVSADRPIAIWHRSLREFVLNTAALKKLGITEALIKEKAIDSSLCNWEEGNFRDAGISVIAAPLLKLLATPEKLESGLTRMLSYMHANGITAWSEADTLLNANTLKLYQKTLASDSAPMYALQVADGNTLFAQNSSETVADATRELIASLPAAPGNHVAYVPDTVSFVVDGAFASQRMQMYNGYLDGHFGEWVLQPEELEKRVKVFWNAGYDLQFELHGDAGVGVVLDMLERRMQEHPRRNQYVLFTGVTSANDEQLNRIHRLGISVSVNPYVIANFADKYAQTGLGRERADTLARNHSIEQLGIPLSLQSEFPLAPASPLALVWAAVNRTTALDHTVGKDEAISLDVALRGITIEAAQALQQQGSLGSIAPGKLANLTILEKNPYDTKPEKLREIPVWGTMFEGKLYPVPDSAKIKSIQKVTLPKSVPAAVTAPAAKAGKAAKPVAAKPAKT